MFPGSVRLVQGLSGNSDDMSDQFRAGAGFNVWLPDSGTTRARISGNIAA